MPGIKLCKHKLSLPLGAYIALVGFLEGDEQCLTVLRWLSKGLNIFSVCRKSVMG